jgi:hypothetical protein
VLPRHSDAGWARFYKEAICSYHCDVIHRSLNIAALRNQELNFVNVSSRNELSIAKDVGREKAHAPAEEASRDHSDQRFHTSNENKMSDGHLERVSPKVKVIQSSEM